MVRTTKIRKRKRKGEERTRVKEWETESKKDNTGAIKWEQMFIHVCPTYVHTKAKKPHRKWIKLPSAKAKSTHCWSSCLTSQLTYNLTAEILSYSKHKVKAAIQVQCEWQTVCLQGQLGEKTCLLSNTEICSENSFWGHRLAGEVVGRGPEGRTMTH